MIEDKFMSATKELREYIMKCKGKCVWDGEGEFEFSFTESDSVQYDELYSKLMKENFPDAVKHCKLTPSNKEEFISNLGKILFTVSELKEVSLKVDEMGNKLFLDSRVSYFSNFDSDDDFLSFDFCFTQKGKTVLFMLYLQYD